MIVFDNVTVTFGNGVRALDDVNALAGIDLPQPMRLELAQQLIKRRTEKSE